MRPSEEAIKAALTALVTEERKLQPKKKIRHYRQEIFEALNAAYVIDVAAMEHLISWLQESRDDWREFCKGADEISDKLLIQNKELNRIIDEYSVRLAEYERLKKENLIDSKK